MTRNTTTSGFTLIEILIALAVIAILAAIGTVYYSQYIEKTKEVEASIALAEIVRLEQLYYTQTGTYSTDLNQLGFQLTADLKYHSIFLQAQGSAKGWGYVALVLPLSPESTQSGGWAIAQYPDGKVQTSMPGALRSGGSSACSVWTGWGSMEGGHIDGEESLRSSSSSSGTSPCGGIRVVRTK